jgi:hypothetical protein
MPYRIAAGEGLQMKGKAVQENLCVTSGDRSALRFMPAGWFKTGELPLNVRRPKWRCKRLLDLGLLETESTMIGGKKYRKVKRG